MTDQPLTPPVAPIERHRCTAFCPAIRRPTGAAPSVATGKSTKLPCRNRSRSGTWGCHAAGRPQGPPPIAKTAVPPSPPTRGPQAAWRARGLRPPRRRRCPPPAPPHHLNSPTPRHVWRHSLHACNQTLRAAATALLWPMRGSPPHKTSPTQRDAQRVGVHWVVPPPSLAGAPQAGTHPPPPLPPIPPLVPSAHTCRSRGMPTLAAWKPTKRPSLPCCVDPFPILKPDTSSDSCTPAKTCMCGSGSNEPKSTGSLDVGSHVLLAPAGLSPSTMGHGPPTRGPHGHVAKLNAHPFEPCSYGPCQAQARHRPGTPSSIHPRAGAPMATGFATNRGNDRSEGLLSLHTSASERWANGKEDEATAAFGGL